MKNIKNIERLIKAIENNRGEIIEKAKEIYPKTINCSCLQGMRVGIIVDVDGNIYNFEWTAGTSTMGIHDGTEIDVINWAVTNDPGEIIVLKDDLTSEEFKNFQDWLLEQSYIDTIDEAEDELTYYTLCEFDENIAYRVIQKTAEDVANEYYREAAEEKIEDTLRYLQSILED